MVFDADNAHRRRSSLVTADNPKLAKQSAERRQNSACFVHSLLEKQQKSRASNANALQHINEDTRADKGVGTLDAQATHSRLLSKRQLSDMAMGVRELSKKLGSIRLKIKVKTVFVLTKAHDESLIGFTRELVEWLLSKERDTPYIVCVVLRTNKNVAWLNFARYVEDTLEKNHIFDAKGLVSKESSREGRLKFWTNELAAKHPLTFDFVVSVRLATKRVKSR